MMSISEENRKILLINGVEFFMFRKIGNYSADLFLSFEAERFCFLFNEAISEKTSNLIKTALNNRLSYKMYENDLIYAPNNMTVGNFVCKNERTFVARTRFLCVLNTKTNFFYSIPESLVKINVCK